MGGKKKKTKKKTAKRIEESPAPRAITPGVVDANTTNRATFLNAKDGDESNIENKLLQMKEGGPS